METTGQFLTPERQAAIRPHETAERPVVGFADDYPAGLRTGIHAHPRAQLLHAVSGVMTIETPTASFITPPSTALLLPANKEHDIRMNGPVEMRTLFLRKNAALKIGDRAMVFTVPPLLRELILAACSEPLDWDLDGRGYFIAELAMDEIVRSKVLPLELPMPWDARVRRVTERMIADPSNERTIEDWAEIANASSRTLTRLFRAETGLSFRQWRQHLRLARALSLIVAGSTPTQAAQKVGFKSVPAFGSAFRELFGMTPAQARRMHQAKN